MVASSYPGKAGHTEENKTARGRSIRPNPNGGPKRLPVTMGHWKKKAEDKFNEFIGICMVAFVIFLFGFAIGFQISVLLAFVVFIVLVLVFFGLTKE